jgi:hypothetical protein
MASKAQKLGQHSQKVLTSKGSVRKAPKGSRNPSWWSR